MGEDGDGCSRWSVAGGDGGELLWMQGRLLCFRDQAEQIVKIPPPPPLPHRHTFGEFVQIGICDKLTI